MPSFRGYNALHVATKCGQRANLQLCLDAGEPASYTSGQKWLDLSGNGYDFFLGADGSATATDPTFNGTAGRLTDAEYFSFDGGDRFDYDTTNEAFMGSISNDSALFTMLFWGYFAGQSGVCGTGNIGSTSAGFSFLQNNGPLQFRTGNGAASNIRNSTFTGPINAWSLIGVSHNEATGAGHFFINGVTESFSYTYTSPNATMATTFAIGSRGAANIPMASGSRLAIAWIWTGRQLGGSESRAIFNATRGRFGV